MYKRKIHAEAFSMCFRLNIAYSQATLSCEQSKCLTLCVTHFFALLFSLTNYDIFGSSFVA